MPAMVVPLARRSFLLATAGILALPRGARAEVQEFDVPYVPTPPKVVEAMLDLARLKAGEHLVDLGSGDGRLPIAAAKRGATALGVEIDPRLVKRARLLAELEAQQAGARFLRADLFTVPLRDADVVTLYLLPEINERLKPKLLVELRPGARVVSHAFDMGDWTPDVAASVEEKNLYLWTIPAVAGGEWLLVRADGTGAALVIEQRYNRVSGTLDGRPIAEARLEGVTLSFVCEGLPYRGIVGERAIAADPAQPGTWRAQRME